MFWNCRNLQFQCFEKAKIQNSNLWKKPKCRIPIFEKRQNVKLQSLEKAKFGIPKFGKKKNFRIPMFGKVEI